MKLVVIGGGEHARVVIEAARSQADPWEVAGFVATQPNEETVERLGVTRLGSDQDVLRLSIKDDVRFVMGLAGVNSRDIRESLARTYDAEGARWATVIHATAWISPTAQLGDGVFVSAGAVVNSGARIGQHAVINTRTIIEHDVVVGEFAQVSPGASIGGAVRVGAGAYIGMGASVRDHVTVGDGAIVGMGAVVVANVASRTTVLGNPARVREESR